MPKKKIWIVLNALHQRTIVRRKRTAKYVRITARTNYPEEKNKKKGCRTRKSSNVARVIWRENNKKSSENQHHYLKKKLTRGVQNTDVQRKGQAIKSTANANQRTKNRIPLSWSRRPWLNDKHVCQGHMENHAFKRNSPAWALNSQADKEGIRQGNPLKKKTLDYKLFFFTFCTEIIDDMTAEHYQQRNTQPNTDRCQCSS